MTTEAHALTDIGRARTINQDYIYSSPEKTGSLPNLFLMADDMGGHRAGDYVSRFVMENLVIYINRAGDGSPVMQSERGIETVDGALYEESLRREELKGMRCTPVAGVMEGNIFYITNTGGSRSYPIRGDFIRQITRDHPYVEEMVAIGQMRRGSEDYNRCKNIIIRAPGIGREVELNFFEVDLEEGDYTLLCSDGLSNMLEDQSMYDTITGEGSLKERAALLIETVNRQGGVDNVVAVLVNPPGRETGVC